MRRRGWREAMRRAVHRNALAATWWAGRRYGGRRDGGRRQPLRLLSDRNAKERPHRQPGPLLLLSRRGRRGRRVGVVVRHVNFQGELQLSGGRHVGFLTRQRPASSWARDFLRPASLQLRQLRAGCYYGPEVAPNGTHCLVAPQIYSLQTNERTSSTTLTKSYRSAAHHDCLFEQVACLERSTRC